MTNKNMRTFAWTLAIAIATLAMPLTACSSDDSPAEGPRQLVASGLRAYAVMPTDTRLAAGALFTDEDIEWFDVNTRELRFRDSMPPLRERLRVLGSIDFYLDDQHLFSNGATFVSLLCSQFIPDLVLCCGSIDNGVIDDSRYFLNDCYPPQFTDIEEVKANRERRAQQWEVFLRYLERKGKLRM